jgi:hypothetical protein
LLLPLSISLAAEPELVCPSTTAGVRHRTDVVFKAWADQARGEYDRQRDLLFEELVCMREVIDTETAARVHLVVAMDAYMARREDTTKAALRSIAVLKPGLELSQIVPLPPDLDDWLRIERQHAGSYQTVRGKWAFDGIQTDQRPSDRPTIAQRLSPGGPASTKLIPATDSLPDQGGWSTFDGPALQTKLRTNPRLWWTASGASAIIATGLWIATAQAGATHQANLDRYTKSGTLPASRRPEVEATLHRANTLGQAAQGFSLASASFGVVAFTVKK